MILALGTSASQDFVAFKAIESELKKRKKEIILFKQDLCLNNEIISYKFSENGSFVPLINIEGKNYDIGSFEGAINLHPMLPRELLGFSKISLRQFIWKQFYEMRRGVWMILKDKKWLNDPFSAEMAENKVFQLVAAQKVGLTIPATLISSSPSDVKNFYLKCGGLMINKILSTSPILDKVTFTHLVDECDIDDNLSILISPAIFQPLIKKEYELRITIVGNKLFSTKINSQENLATSIDWRVHPVKKKSSIQMEPTLIPLELEVKILNLMRLLNLNYGAVDMIVTPQGDYVFLEINPSGQWYFIQENTRCNDIASAIADFLC
ncbi:MAG: hypothetical protein KBC42_00745 [Candidatus Pacebacteria bacterium]|nr:hypothetical protein [Candidatus Paceibacterota bacterium]MBP9780436.1 hypothetical protein [Candidatus Paceibacterota bacterium]